jgi:hypothetical protein
MIKHLARTSLLATFMTLTSGGLMAADPVVPAPDPAPVVVVDPGVQLTQFEQGSTDLYFHELTLVRVGNVVMPIVHDDDGWSWTLPADHPLGQVVVEEFFANGEHSVRTIVVVAPAPDDQV